MSYMRSFRSHDHLRKVCALLAATLILPALAYADKDGKDKDGKDKDKGKDPGDKIPIVPEANAAWVLIPFFGAVLLFSSRRFFSANLAKK